MDNLKNKSFNEIMLNIEALKSYYRDIIASFSYFELNKRNEFKRKTKKTIYKLNFEDWKKDIIWETLNENRIDDYETSDKNNDSRI